MFNVFLTAYANQPVIQKHCCYFFFAKLSSSNSENWNRFEALRLSIKCTNLNYFLTYWEQPSPSYEPGPPILLFCLNRQLPLLGLEIHSLRACLFLCPCSNRVLSLSIAPDIHLSLDALAAFFKVVFFLVCHVAILMNPARGILFAHCAFDVFLSPPLFPAHSDCFWPPF